MPRIHTHLHLGCLLEEKIEIENFYSFQLGNVYPDCFDFSVDEALARHYKKDSDDECDLNECLKYLPFDSFTLGQYFHLWVDHYIQYVDLKDITKSDCLICDMEVLHEVLYDLSQLEFMDKEKEAMDVIHTLDRLPMPLYLVGEDKKKEYHQLLTEIVEQFIERNKQYLQIKTFKKMRRSQQELSVQDTIEIFEKATSGTLALLDEQGYPYAIPLSFVYDDGKLYFHSSKTGHKIDAIMNHKKASFCVIDQDEIIAEKYTTYFRSAIAFGKISLLNEPGLKHAAIQKLAEKYSYDYKDGIEAEIKHASDSLCMIQLKIEKMSGKEAIELVRNRK